MQVSVNFESFSAIVTYLQKQRLASPLLHSAYPRRRMKVIATLFYKLLQTYIMTKYRFGTMWGGLLTLAPPMNKWSVCKTLT